MAFAESVGTNVSTNPIDCSVACQLQWINFATSLLDFAKRGSPGALVAVQLFHAELLKRISGLTDREAARLEATFTEFEEKLQVVVAEHEPN